MKSQQFFIIILIALGAITGSTLAAISYLNNRESVSNDQSSLPESTANSLPPNSTSDLELNTPTDLNSSPQPNPNTFPQFRVRLLDATKRRDANFIRNIVTTKTRFSFDSSINLDAYNIDDPQSLFWQYMEKAVSTGCTIEPDTQVPEQELGSDIWVCPITSGKPIYDFGWQEQMGILGESVNVRSEPGTGASIVTVLSKEVVKFDAKTFNNLPQRLQEEVNSPNGWTPVVLTNGKKGWVQNRFLYHEPRDYKVSFIRSNGEWQINYFLRGNGNYSNR